MTGPGPLTIPTATSWLVTRGFQRKDWQGKNNSYIPPADGHYWTLLPATESLDGQSWLWIYGQGDTDISLALVANQTGNITAAHVQESWVVTTVAISEPVGSSLEQLLNDRATIAIAIDHLLALDSQCPEAEALLPAGWGMAEAGE